MLDDVVGLDTADGLALAFLSCRAAGWGDDPDHGERDRAGPEGASRRSPSASSARVLGSSPSTAPTFTVESPAAAPPAGDVLCRRHQPPDARPRRRTDSPSPRTSRSPRSNRPSPSTPAVGRDAELVRRSVTPAALCYRWDNVWLSAARGARRTRRADRAERRAADDPPRPDPPDRPVDRPDRPDERRDGRRRHRLPGGPRPRRRRGDRRPDDRRARQPTSAARIGASSRWCRRRASVRATSHRSTELLAGDRSLRHQRHERHRPRSTSCSPTPGGTGATRCSSAAIAGRHRPTGHVVQLERDDPAAARRPRRRPGHPRPRRRSRSSTPAAPRCDTATLTRLAGVAQW